MTGGVVHDELLPAEAAGDLGLAEVGLPLGHLEDGAGPRRNEGVDDAGVDTFVDAAAAADDATFALAAEFALADAMMMN